MILELFLIYPLFIIYISDYLWYYFILSFNFFILIKLIKLIFNYFQQSLYKSFKFHFILYFDYFVLTIWNAKSISNHLQQSDLPDSMISRMKGNCSRDRRTTKWSRNEISNVRDRDDYKRILDSQGCFICAAVSQLSGTSCT